MAGSTTLASLKILIGADTSGVAGPLRQAKREVENVGVATQRTALNTRALGSQLLTLGGQATGISPSLLRIGNLFSSGVTLAATGGLAVIGFAMRKLTEDTRELAKQTEATLERLTDLGSALAYQGNKPLMDDRDKAQGQVDRIRGEIAGRQEQIARIGSLGLPGIGAGKAMEELKKLQAELGVWEGALFDANLALQRAIPSIDGIAVSVDRLLPLAERMRALGVNLGFGAGLDARLGVVRPGPDTRPDWVRGLAPSLTSMSGSGAGMEWFHKGASKFMDAVDSFKGGVKEMVKGTFSSTGLANIGANLASSGITMAVSFATTKLMEGIGSLFTTSAERLAEVMEKNTRALAATGDFLRARVEGSGFSGLGNDIIGAITEVLNKVAVGDLSESDKITNFRREVEKALGMASGEFLDWGALGKALGIDTSILTPEVLDQLAQQLAKAGFAAADLADAADRAAAALSNIPSGYNVAHVRWGSSDPDLQRSAARGGTPMLRPSYAR